MDATSKLLELVPSLEARDAEEAWDEFLRDYSSLVLQVVHLFERDPDRVDDCFVFVCEQLKRNNRRRIRSFDSSGPASFRTWLRAVARNLCLDWRRKRFGRPRIFRSVSRLSPLDQEVYRSINHRGLSEDETLHAVKALHPTLTRADLADSLIRIRKSLTSRQSWILASRHPSIVPISRPSRDVGAPDLERHPPDPRADPEVRAEETEALRSLHQVLDELPTEQRLLLRLRFEQELALADIARVTGLESPVKVERMIRRALRDLEKQLRERGFDSPCP